MIRIGAVGDVHMDADVLGRYRPALNKLPEHADVLLLAGDLTRHGTVSEARCVAEEFRGLDIPVVAVLGNHDHHSDQADDVTEVLRDAGMTILEGAATVVDTPNGRVGVAGVKGYCGGFAERCATAFGEREMKSFVRVTEESAENLEAALEVLDADIRVALMHYSPIPDTLVGEPLEIYPFLGSYLLAEAIDRVRPQLAVHGHAHYGSPSGHTTGGVPVRNVAQPVIKHAYTLLEVAVPAPAA